MRTPTSHFFTPQRDPDPSGPPDPNHSDLQTPFIETPNRPSIPPPPLQDPPDPLSSAPRCDPWTLTPPPPPDPPHLGPSAPPQTSRPVPGVVVLLHPLIVHQSRAGSGTGTGSHGGGRGGLRHLIIAPHLFILPCFLPFLLFIVIWLIFHLRLCGERASVQLSTALPLSGGSMGVGGGPGGPQKCVKGQKESKIVQRRYGGLA